MRGYFFTGTVRHWQVIVPDLGTVEGPFQISTLEYGGQHDGEVTFDLGLESAGALSRGGSNIAGRGTRTRLSRGESIRSRVFRNVPKSARPRLSLARFSFTSSCSKGAILCRRSPGSSPAVSPKATGRRSSAYDCVVHHCSLGRGRDDAAGADQQPAARLWRPRACGAGRQGQQRESRERLDKP